MTFMQIDTYKTGLIIVFGFVTMFSSHGEEHDEKRQSMESRIAHEQFERTEWMFETNGITFGILREVPDNPGKLTIVAKSSTALTNNWRRDSGYYRKRRDMAFTVKLIKEVQGNKEIVLDVKQIGSKFPEAASVNSRQVKPIMLTILQPSPILPVIDINQLFDVKEDGEHIVEIQFEIGKLVNSHIVPVRLAPMRKKLSLIHSAAE